MPGKTSTLQIFRPRVFDPGNLQVAKMLTGHWKPLDVFCANADSLGHTYTSAIHPQPGH